MKTKAVIFDIGGVLAPDVWENVLLDSDTGLARRHNIEYGIAEAVGQSLWNQFGLHKATSMREATTLEREYWLALRDRLSLKESVNELAAMADKVIYPNSGMMSVIRDVYQSGAQILICSNNTEFWFFKQSTALSLSDYVREEDVILSCRVGCFKSSSDGRMFEAVINALKVEKSQSVFFDDRDHNVQRARAMGIPAVVFPSDPEFGESFARNRLRLPREM